MKAAFIFAVIWAMCFLLPENNMTRAIGIICGFNAGWWFADAVFNKIFGRRIFW